MPGFRDPVSLITFGYSDGEDNWGGAMNRNLRQIAYLAMNPAVQSQTATPPTLQASDEGKKYIVLTGATGAWSTYSAGDIAVWGRSETAPATIAWQRFTPVVGQQVYLISDTKMIVYTGTAWQDV